MSKYRQPFLTELKRHWAQRLPEWHQGICAPLSWARKDGTWTNSSALKSTGLAFHAVIHFTPKWPGAFTCEVIVATNLGPLGDNAPIRWDDDIPALPIGRYRIGAFVAGHDIWWRLVDDAAQTRRLYEELGIDCGAFHITRQPNHWYATFMR